MYAVVETGGKQYRVSAGDTVDVEKMPAAVGEQVNLEHVLLVAEGDTVRVGRPLVEGAHVQATVVEQDLGPKVTIFKYMAKERYRRKGGHRQEITRLHVDNIVLT
ncbi:MAG: 50S ribosomal protein L21 [Anaerolineae bacterium]|nr:50S ribosomal protein L21 [Anaerolineae bacterium]